MNHLDAVASSWLLPGDPRRSCEAFV